MDKFEMTVTDVDGFKDVEEIEAVSLEDAKEQAMEILNWTSEGNSTDIEKENN